MNQYKFIENESETVIVLNGKLDVFLIEQLSKTLLKQLQSNISYIVDISSAEEITLPFLQMIVSIQKSNYSLKLDLNNLSKRLQDQISLCGINHEEFNLK